MESLKTKKLELEIVRRSYDDRWIVNAPISSARIGETDRDAIKRKDCVDYLMSLSVFVGKSESDCKRWLDRNKPSLLKLGIAYEVGSS